MAIVLNGTTGITTPDINSTTGLDAADITGALPAIDGSALTGINEFKPVAVTGTTPSLDAGSYNFFDHGTLTANATVSFTNVPTNANWRYSFTPNTVSGAWSVTTATHSQVFSVTLQDITPLGFFFKPDGTKMYVIGLTNDRVYEYDLSTAWDISTATYLQFFSVATQLTTPTSISFKPDGTKMYVVGYTVDGVYEYDLSTAWDVTTATYSQNFSVGGQETVPQGFFFKPDGTKMYITGAAGDDVNEYNLSTAWDISTASYSQVFSVATEETYPTGIFFKPDGTKMYIGGTSVHEYDLSTAWDVTTASFLQDFSVSVQENSPQDVFFKPDGTKMYVLGNANDEVHQYEVGVVAAPTFPVSVTQITSRVLAGERVTYEFFTLDGGTTVTLIGEEIL